MSTIVPRGGRGSAKRQTLALLSAATIMATLERNDRCELVMTGLSGNNKRLNGVYEIVATPRHIEPMLAPVVLQDNRGPVRNHKKGRARRYSNHGRIL